MKLSSPITPVAPARADVPRVAAPSVDASERAASRPAAPTAEAAQLPSAPPVRDTLERIASQMQDYLRRNGRNLEFRVDQATHQTVISVRDASTGELVRQIPSEEALHIAQRLTADSGTLLDAMV